MKMPAPDKHILSRRRQIIGDLEAIIASAGGSGLTAGSVISDPISLKAYECDGLSAYRQLPMVVVLPNSTHQVSDILRYCHENQVKVVARGSGTSLSGGALPLEDAVMIGLGKFNKIIEIDYGNRCVVTQPGVSNLAISESVAEKEFYYAPDPSSQIVCSIGGGSSEGNNAKRVPGDSSSPEFLSEWILSLDSGRGSEKSMTGF